jgi:hypothetical protein
MRRAAIPIPHESEEQKAVAEYLDRRKLLWCHVPNGAGILGGKLTGSRIYKLNELKAMGVKKGVPDVLIFSPSPRFPAATGAAVELKRKKDGRVSPEQAVWLADLKAQGWLTAVCKGASEAIKQLQEWGY